MMRFHRTTGTMPIQRTVLPFPQQARHGKSTPLSPLSCVDDVLAAFNTVSRRIDDLARELKCLGYFGDDNDDRPRAA